MTLEIVVAVAIVTALRLAWIATRQVPRDVSKAIMPGLKNIGRVLRGEARVEGNAPYGIVWYAVNVPLARAFNYDGRSWTISLALIDAAFLWISQGMGLLGFLTYILIGTFQLFRAPWNASINWLILLGLVNWWFLLLAPIAKLPVGLPAHAWGDTGRGLFYKHNFVYYGLLGTLWLILLFTLFVPWVRDLSVVVLGVLWGLVLGYLYIRRVRGTIFPTAKQPSS